MVLNINTDLKLQRFKYTALKDAKGIPDSKMFWYLYSIEELYSIDHYKWKLFIKKMIHKPIDY